MFDTVQVKKLFWIIVLGESFAKKCYQNIGQSGYE